VQSVCDEIPSCCDEAWGAECVDALPATCGVVACQTGSGECLHSICLEGEALEAGCDTPPLAESCVEMICDVQPDCCNPELDWTEACVAAVADVCGLSC
jgi:hypothetical protein